jgi:hypothetical protein
MRHKIFTNFYGFNATTSSVGLVIKFNFPGKIQIIQLLTHRLQSTISFNLGLQTARCKGIIRAVT